MEQMAYIRSGAGSSWCRSRRSRLPVSFVPTPLAGAYVIEQERHEDERGFFARTWCRREFEEHGLEHAARAVQRLVQSPARHPARPALPGAAPFPEVKLVRCTRGAFFDVVVDLRPRLPDLPERVGVGVERRETGRRSTSRTGFAHGFFALADATEVAYQISTPYKPEAARGVRWNDPAFRDRRGRRDDRTICDRDRMYPDISVRIGGVH